MIKSGIPGENQRETSGKITSVCFKFFHIKKDKHFN